MNYKSKNKRVSFGLVTLPFLIFLGIVISLSLIVYLYQDRFYFASLHKNILWDSLYSKKMQLQGLLDHKKATLESISKSQEIKSNIELIETDPSNIKSRREARIAEDKRREALNQLKSIILSGSGAGQFGLLSIISRDGRVIVSSSEDLVGTSIADTDLFKKHLVKVSRPMVIGSWQDQKRGYEFHIISPVLDGQGNVYAYLHGSINILALASALKEGIKGNTVFELIDRQGKVLLSTEEIVSRRYNPALINIDNQLHYYDGLFVNMTPLNNTELILLQKAQSLSLLYPIIEVIIIFSSLTLLVLIILLYQSIYLRRQVTEPLVKLFAAIRSSTAGLRPVFPQKSHPAEIDNLVKAVQQLITDFVMNKNKPQETKNDNTEPPSNTASSNKDMESGVGTVESQTVAKPLTPPTVNGSYKMIQPLVEDKTDLTAPIVSFLQDTTEGLKTSLYKSLSVLADDTEFHRLRQDALLLSCVADNYAFIKSYEGKVLGADTHTFSMQEVFDELSSHLQSLKDLGHIETLYDFDQSIGTVTVRADKRLLLRVLLNLIYNAFASTKEGTITVVASQDDREGGTIKIHISDTGSGYEESEIEAIKGGINSSAPALTLAFMLAGLVGMTVSVESIKGKGSVYTISVFEF